MKFEASNAAIKARVNAARDIGMVALGEQALKDANFFCKEYSGALLDGSAIYEGSRTEKILDGIALTWNTPYAKRQYYTGQPSPDVNPNASKMWAHTGEEANKDTHLAILQKAAREGSE